MDIERQTCFEAMRSINPEVNPDPIFEEAESIVKAHRPSDPALEGFEPIAWKRGVSGEKPGGMDNPRVKEYIATKLRINVDGAPSLLVALMIDELIEKGEITQDQLDMLNRGEIPEE
ncbi:hypothetical protein ISS85_03530 [Candidatus Microgenomates bacterium]|nr:hypothetical protein [Candidatus Microgenomates bacterium]